MDISRFNKVAAELHDITEKRDKLNQFMDDTTQAWCELSDMQQNFLGEQLIVMGKYAFILVRRLSRALHESGSDVGGFALNKDE